MTHYGSAIAGVCDRSGCTGVRPNRGKIAPPFFLFDVDFCQSTERSYKRMVNSREELNAKQLMSSLLDGENDAHPGAV
jgi:hypothetical protein